MINESIFKLDKDIIIAELINTYKNPEAAKSNPLITDLISDYSDIICRLNESLHSLLNNNIKIDYLNPDDFKDPFGSSYIINDLFHLHLFKDQNNKKRAGSEARILRINLIFDFHKNKYSFNNLYTKDNDSFDFHIFKTSIHNDKELNFFNFSGKDNKRNIISMINLNYESFLNTLKHNFYDKFFGKVNDKIENDEFSKHFVKYIENNLTDIYINNSENINKKFEIIKEIGKIYKPILIDRIHEQNNFCIKTLIERNDYMPISQFITDLEEINPLLSITYDVDFSEQLNNIKTILKKDIKNTISNC